MTKPTPQGSLENLVKELTVGPGAPIVVAGERGSGRSAVIDAAAASMGYRIEKREAFRLNLPLGSDPPSGAVVVSVHAQGLTTVMNDLETVAPLSIGEPVLVVIDHVEMMQPSEIAEITRAVQRLAGLVPVVVVATPRELRRLPSSWRRVEHGLADAVRWRPPARTRYAREALSGQ